MMSGEFTGRKMLALMVGGFGIVIAVNLTMASFATGSFSGVVVENSYVASQKFNGWLDQAKRQEALGWSADVAREGDRLVVQTEAVPVTALVSAELRRPIGEAESQPLTFAPGGQVGTMISNERVPDGRWIVRVTISSAGQIWRDERQIR